MMPLAIHVGIRGEVYTYGGNHEVGVRSRAIAHPVECGVKQAARALVATQLEEARVRLVGRHEPPERDGDARRGLHGGQRKHRNRKVLQAGRRKERRLRAAHRRLGRSDDGRGVGARARDAPIPRERLIVAAGVRGARAAVELVPEERRRIGQHGVARAPRRLAASLDDGDVGLGRRHAHGRAGQQIEDGGRRVAIEHQEIARRHRRKGRGRGVSGDGR